MRRLPLLESFLVALAVILLEVGYTRIFSFKVVYYFTYLLIGLALLGLGSGGVLVAVTPGLRADGGRRTIALGCLIGGAAALAGYVVVALTPFNLFGLVHALRDLAWPTVALETLHLAVVCSTLFVPFLAAGTALAVIFATHSAAIGRLYAADLAGAGLGCAIVIPLMVAIGPPGTVCLAGGLLAAAGLRSAAGTAKLLLGATAAAGLVVGAALPDRLPDPVPDAIKNQSPTIFTRWHPIFRVDVAPVRGAVPPTHFLIHDGTAGSVINQYDGNPASLARYDQNERSIPFGLLGPEPDVLILGSAGGNEILASLHFDAARITGVELNPVTLSLLTTHFADFSGHIATHPKVTLQHGEGRSFLRGSDRRWDLVWLVAPDSYAAMNAATSGAFVLSESYLYTEEMIRDVFAHLAPGGLLAAQFGEFDFEAKPNRTLRYLGTTRQALRAFGVAEPHRHVLVATSPGFGRLVMTTILVRCEPFSEADAARFRAAVGAVPGAAVVYDAGRPAAAGALRDVLELPEVQLAAWYDAYPFTVGPITDDAPFFWSFVRLRDALFGFETPTGLNIEEGVGEQVMFVLLGFVTVFAALLLLLPFRVLPGAWSQVRGKPLAGIYFAALGLGFMFIEICLIQRLTLFLGFPTYSLTVTLFALLVSSGLGSLASERWTNPVRAVRGCLVVLAMIVVLYDLGLPPLLAAGVGWPFPVRAVVTVALLAPLGLCLGAFMPLGLRFVAGTTPHREAFVAWCWAVNGFFSVTSSVVAALLSIAFGFRTVMFIAFGIYLMGVLSLQAMSAATARATVDSRG